MCGIFGYVGKKKKNVVAVTLSRLEETGISRI